MRRNQKPAIPCTESRFYLCGPANVTSRMHRFACQVRGVPTAGDTVALLRIDLRILFPPHLTEEDQAGETTWISKGCFNVRATHKKVCGEGLGRGNALTQYVGRTAQLCNLPHPLAGVFGRHTSERVEFNGVCTRLYQLLPDAYGEIV